jgi:cytochrome oxidase Cu insertion factor (SCO1/SenC/PrrC family)
MAVTVSLIFKKAVRFYSRLTHNCYAVCRTKPSNGLSYFSCEKYEQTMKYSIILLIVATTLVSATGKFLGDGLKTGDKAPAADLEMTDLDGTKTTLEKLNGENGICVIFSCNTCPYVIAWEDRYPELQKTCTANGVALVLINSNEAKREGADSLEEMVEHAKEKGYSDVHYLVDENHTLADAFGANRTPEVFLFNSEMALTYQGAIDDDMKDASKVEKPYLTNAIDNMVAGKPAEPDLTKSIGCTIKRVKS